MSRHDPTVYLKHMRDHATEAIEMIGATSADQLRDDRMRLLAITHLIQIIGEAANRVPKEFQAMHTDLPWHLAIGMRNIIVHGYEIVEHGVIWDTAVNSLPELLKQIEAILDKTN